MVRCSKSGFEVRTIVFLVYVAMVTERFIPFLSTRIYRASFFFFFFFYFCCGTLGTSAKRLKRLVIDSHRGGPGSNPGLVMWNLWWTKRRWGRFSPNIRFPLSIFIPQIFLHNHHHLSSGADTIGQYWPQYQKSHPNNNKKKKTRKPWRPIGLREVMAPILLRQTANRWRQGCQLYAPALLYPHVSLFIKIPGTHFCWRLSRHQGHNATGRIR
jgi:hypothetical protein